MRASGTGGAGEKIVSVAMTPEKERGRPMVRRIKRGWAEGTRLEGESLGGLREP